MRDGIPEIVDESPCQLIWEFRRRIESAEKADEVLKEEFVIILNTFDFGIQQLKESSDILEPHIVELCEKAGHLRVVIIARDIGIFRDGSNWFAD